MEITLSPQTQKLLAERMEKGGYSSPDDAVRAALETLEEVEGVALEDLDEDTRAAIERADEESRRGEGRPWAQVRDELRKKYLKK